MFIDLLDVVNTLHTINSNKIIEIKEDVKNIYPNGLTKTGDILVILENSHFVVINKNNAKYLHDKLNENGGKK